jgi:mRNA interferase MazF
MIEYKRGDIVLVNFVFTEETGEKRRPALVVSSDAYHLKRQESVVLAITSRTDRILVGDHLIHDWQNAGLIFPSVATGIIRTIKQDVIARKLGAMTAPDMRAIEANLREILGLR